MAFDEGFNFRATEAFVTDGADEQHVDDTDTYPTTANGVTFGYESGPDGHRDRDSGVDRRLAGIGFTVNDGDQHVFRVDLDNAVEHEIHAAFGDTSNAQKHWVVLDDDATQIAAYSAVDTDNNQTEYLDATGVVRSDWPTNEVALSHTFASTILRVQLGAPTSQTLSTTIAHLRVVEVGGAESISGTSAGTSTDSVGNIILNIAGSNTSAGTSTDTATASLTIGITGTAAGTSLDSATATVDDTEQITATGAGTSTDTAAATLTVALSGTAAGTSVDTATATTDGKEQITATGAGTSLDTATATLTVQVSGTSAGTSVDSATQTDTASLVATGVGTSTDTGTASLTENPSGTSAGTSTDSASATAILSLTATGAGASADTGVLTDALEIFPPDQNIVIARPRQTTAEAITRLTTAYARPRKTTAEAN